MDLNIISCKLDLNIISCKLLKELFTSLNPDIILLEETMCDHLTALRFSSLMKPGYEFCAIDALGL